MEFERFKSLLPELFPTVYSNSGYEEVGDRAILLRWRGKSSEAPTVLMAHYDVVSAEEPMWDKPAFEAILENGVIWGRGALDTKHTFNGVLSAADHLIAEGFTPKNDIYFAFSGNEEVNGKGAPNIVDLFEKKGITPAFVLPLCVSLPPAAARPPG